MEDTLRAKRMSLQVRNIPSLNPCFNGRYSQSARSGNQTYSVIVLILVLMEDTLREGRQERYGS